MKTFTTIFLTLISIHSFGHVDNREKIDYECQGDFANASEAEQCWAERLFRTEYKAGEHKKFEGKVIHEGTIFRFGKDEFEVIDTSEDLLTVFEQGLLHPGIMAGSYEDRRKEVKLKISNLEEIQIPDTPPGTKRFRFMISYPKVANPIVYFIELTGERLNDNDLKSFIKKSRLTFYKQGWVML
jgi:hypothetical protein